MEKGLSYCPNNKADDFELFLDLHKFVRKLTLQRYFKICENKKRNDPEEARQKDVISTPARPGKIKEVRCKSKFYPIEAQGQHLSTLMDIVQEEFQIIEKKMVNSKRNLSKGEQRALKTLKNNEEIVIRAADKGGGIVIQDFQDYKQEALNILSDKEYYEKI